MKGLITSPDCVARVASRDKQLVQKTKQALI